MLNGNMKNNREVCCAVDAGYAEFSGLPGRVRTGCPGFKSRYCYLHAPIVATTHETPTEERPGIIVDKRITRNSTTYQVSMHNYLRTGKDTQPFMSPSTLYYDACEALPDGYRPFYTSQHAVYYVHAYMYIIYTPLIF